MGKYHEALRGLNAAQKDAVTTIEGPVLVIAGPGTGKTQLLSVRVAHILQKTDTLPQNILCLTFTENGAENMRERLTRFIGQDAYGVGIGTYHSFGGDLIRRFPEAFAETRLQTPADELTKRQIFKEIVEGLSYTNPLKQMRHHLGDLMSTISEVKRALLDADSLRAIAAENMAFIIAANDDVLEVFAGQSRLPSSAVKAIPLFTSLHEALTTHELQAQAHPAFGSLAALATSELAKALAEAENINKSTPLTAWKNNWLAKDDTDRFIFDGTLVNQRIEALADVFEKYQAALALEGWYDFDDMILRAVQALEQNPEIRYSLQEKYLYILLDEFQDTNAAQLKLVQLLSDSPAHEGRPNVLAVGDDDQAIYAFQGAQYSNMLDFYRMYCDVKVVNLTQNYRSSADILHTARNISLQIEARLEKHFDQMSKELVAANPNIPNKADIRRHEFQSDVAQYDWIANEIQRLIQEGIDPSEIAVLAPKHRQLEPLVPYLAERAVPIRYEKRENILQAPVVRQLITMSHLVLALQKQEWTKADSLWPEILSFDFWNIPTSEIWKLSWRVSDSYGENRLTWTEALLESEKPFLQAPGLLFTALAGRAKGESCELMLDYLIGSEPVTTHEPDKPTVRSPLRSHYVGPDVQQKNPELFYDTVSHLTVLRARLRDHAAVLPEALTLQDFTNYIDMFDAAEERMLNTSPYNQQANAVQLMTVFKAKGLEFKHVFMPSLQDDVWGSSSRGNSNKFTLPANLSPIRHAGANDDERLRLLFVAVTRAKFGLHLTSFTKTYSGKGTKRLQYLNEQQQDDSTFRTLVLPTHSQEVISNDHTAPTLDSLEMNWRQRHVEHASDSDLRAVLASRLSKYQLSPTHLTCFIDLEYGGPQQFFFNYLLRFPQAPTIDSQFGNAIHSSLEWMQHQLNIKETLPTEEAVLEFFTTKLHSYRLPADQLPILQERGQKALQAFLKQRVHIFKSTDKAEYSFKREGVFVGDVHMAGNIDRIEVNHATKEITVVDYKTGKSYSKWMASDMRLHKYTLQLYCYKLLIEGSHAFKGYTVTEGRLEFVEPDYTNTVHSLSLTFRDDQVQFTKKLLQGMWQRVQDLDWPDISAYSQTLTGIKQFEADLTSE